MSEVRPLGNGRFLVTGVSGQRLAYAVASGDTRWVFVEGQTFVIDRRKPHTGRHAREQARTHDDMALMAPMPATVVGVKVTPGDRVARGDVLLMLEAMKMELPIVAPRDAVVKAIACREGELVQPGVPLVELE